MVQKRKERPFLSGAYELKSSVGDAEWADIDSKALIILKTSKPCCSVFLNKEASSLTLVRTFEVKEVRI